MKFQEIHMFNWRKIFKIVLLCCVSLVVGLLAYLGLYRVTVTGTPASAPAPVLGIVVNRNMQVVYIEKGGAADKGGIKKGDILKSINSKNVTRPDAARKAFYATNSSQKSKLVVVRDGKEIILEIQPAAPPASPGQPTPTPVPPDMTYF